MSVWDLVGQARALAHWVSEYRATHNEWLATGAVRQETITVEEMSQVLRDSLDRAPSPPLDALPLLLSQPTPAHRACLFLGLLEMVRDQEIQIEKIREANDLSDCRGELLVQTMEMESLANGW